MADAYGLVGFQNHLRYGEQARVLRMIPGMEQAEFLQYGQIHRNTYICAPRFLARTFQMREKPTLFFAGQITGVEGYVESVAAGWLAGLNAARQASGLPLKVAPSKSATGALARYISSADAKTYQPANITFALLEPLSEENGRRVRRHVRPAYFGPEWGLCDTPVVRREHLTSEAVRGPIIVEEYDATTVVPPGCSATLDVWGNITIDIEGEA